MKDTTTEIQHLLRERLLMRSGTERVQMGSDMFEVARAMTIASFPSGLSKLQIKARLCERFYGNEINVEAFISHLEQRGED
jgi:hypothetical protein